VRVAYYVNGSIRKVNQNNLPYDPIDVHTDFANKIGADLGMSTWEVSSDPKSISLQELMELPFERSKQPPGYYPDLFWQHVNYCEWAACNYEVYDVLVRGRWDNIYNEDNIDLISESITACYTDRMAFGFCNSRYRALDESLKNINDHVIIHPAKSFDPDFTSNFFRTFTGVWEEMAPVRQSQHAACKAEHIWWWLLCGRTNLPYKNIRLSE